MKKLGNVLFVTSPEAFLSLKGETVVIQKDQTTSMRMPLHNIENIVCFTYLGVSPALMGACADRGIGLCFLRPSGRFLARVSGRQSGNVLLRKKQYQMAQQDNIRDAIAVSCLLGKLANCKKVIDRARRDHALLVDGDALKKVSDFHKSTLKILRSIPDAATQRGLEGSAAKQYFGVFEQLVLHQKDDFPFPRRSRRPPLDNLNSLLSFFYTLLTYEVVSALEVVGLDPYVGFFHADRPGRPSLALDLMEELRPVFADRLALSLVNRQQISGAGFVQKESGGVLMDEETRKIVLTAWQKRKQETITHPFLKERIPFGLLPYVQAMLLARFLRGDLDAYPPYFWQ